MRNILNDFKFVPDGVTTLVDALCNFVKEEISFGRIKGGDRFPTIDEISKVTGLTFGQARRVTERLAREGYVRSRPHLGTVVLRRSKNMLRGRVLFILPDVDVGRYHPCQMMDVLSRKLPTAGYAFSIATFSLDARDNLTVLKNELLRVPDLVIATRATPQVQKCLVESGVKHIFVYGDKPMDDDRRWIRFAPETAFSNFADHCARAGVKHVVQVRFEDSELLDVQPALAERGIDCSWVTISRSEKRWGRFDGIVHCAYEAFMDMQTSQMSDLLLFWNSFITQGASLAFLSRGIRLPEDVKVVTLSNTGVGPVYVKPFTRFELDPFEVGEKVADFALAVLTKGRAPRTPEIAPQYVFGETFPF